MVERGTSPKSLMEGSKGYQEPDSSLTVCDVCCPSKVGPSVGGSTPPFIDEGDGFTSERERVRMLLSLAAHAGGYNIMVGAYNTIDATIECQDGYRVLLRAGYGLW